MPAGSGPTITATPAGATVTMRARRGRPCGTGSIDAVIAALVQGTVLDASTRGKDAARLLIPAYVRAVELVRAVYPNAPPTERVDRVVAIVTYVLNGPEQIDHLAFLDSGKTRTIQYLRDIAANDPDGHRFVRYGDGTEDQAFHVGFFVAAGYAARRNAARIDMAQIGSLFLETLAPYNRTSGTHSRANLAAGSAGLMAGIWLSSEARDEDLLAPAIIAGFVGDAGTPAPQVNGMNAEERKAARAMMQNIHEFRGHPLYRLVTGYNPLAVPSSKGALKPRVPPASGSGARRGEGRDDRGEMNLVPRRALGGGASPPRAMAKAVKAA